MFPVRNQLDSSGQLMQRFERIVSWRGSISHVGAKLLGAPQQALPH